MKNLFITRRIFLALPILTLLISFFVFAGFTNPEPGKTAAIENWVGTWSTAPQLVEPNNNPPEPGLTNNTLRQVV